MAKMIENGWAIMCEHGLYSGWHRVRRHAIAEHIHDLRRLGEPELTRFALGRGLSKNQQAAWARCQKRGDRVVKVTLTYQPR